MVRSSGNTRLQLRGIQVIERAFKLDHERRELLVLARLNAEELVHLSGHLLERQECVRNRVFHPDRRQLGLQRFNHRGDWSQLAFRTGPADHPPKLPIHHEPWHQPLAGMGQPPVNVRQGIEVMLRPVEPVLKLIGRHAGRRERDVFPVVMGPVAVENPPPRFVPGVQRSAGKRRQHVEVGKLAVIANEELDRPLEHRFVVVVESEHDAGIHHDPIFVKHLDLFFELLHLVEGLVRFAEAFLENGLHADEDRHAAALGRQLDHLLVVAQEQRALAAPLDVERLERGPEFTAVGAIAVVQVIHECEDPAILHTKPDFGRNLDRFKHRTAPDPPHQFVADETFDAFDLGYHL